MKDTFQHRTNYVLAAGALALLVCTVVWIARVILLLLFAAALFSILIQPAIQWIETKLRLSRISALLVACLAAVTLIAVVIVLSGPGLMNEWNAVYLQLPIAVQQASHTILQQGWAHWLDGRFHASEPAPYTRFVLGTMTNAVSRTASLVFGALVVFFAGLYLTLEPHVYIELLLRIVPEKRRTHTRQVLSELKRALRGWMLAKFVSMLTIGLLLWFGLLGLAIPLAGTLALLSALLTFIPNLGPFLSGIPAGLLAFSISPQKGIWTVTLYVCAYFLEGHVVTPFAERRYARLPPALTLAAQLILALVAGTLGVALAAPLMAAALCLMKLYSPHPKRAEVQLVELDAPAIVLQPHLQPGTSNGPLNLTPVPAEDVGR